jgi:S-DNA-T family DNA segregation ATPase FtsK/SpoIIIE
MTVDQVLRKRSELLTTFGLNVISVRPEPGAVVIAIERRSRQLIGVESLWKRWRPDGQVWGNQELPIAVRENDGTLLFLSPGRLHAPHTLIAGTTGSGKSVLVQNIILAIAATNTPVQARILLIDPKQGVDYFLFEDLPHLEGGIIDDQDAATVRLTALVAEMDRRYVRFREARVPNLAAYNMKVAPDERLPTIWLIHDEFAEWMLTDTYKDAVSNVVQRLGVKARAAGIYLVFAAQRPDANVMPMQLRANLGNRLILRVDSEGTSEISLGEKGAERLLGRGHLLAKLEGERDLCYAQVPFVGATFAESVVRALQDHPAIAEGG